MSLSNKLLIALSLISIATQSAIAAECSAKSGAQTVPLLELYTSESKKNEDNEKDLLCEKISNNSDLNCETIVDNDQTKIIVDVDNIICQFVVLFRYKPVKYMQVVEAVKDDNFFPGKLVNIF